jgi:hypothetical protein
MSLKTLSSNRVQADLILMFNRTVTDLNAFKEELFTLLIFYLRTSKLDAITDNIVLSFGNNLIFNLMLVSKIFLSKHVDIFNKMFFLILFNRYIEIK